MKKYYNGSSRSKQNRQTDYKALEGQDELCKGNKSGERSEVTSSPISGEIKQK